MSHTRFELGFPRHRKVFRLSDAAYRLWSSAIDYAREQRTNGRIEKVDLAAIPRGAVSGGGWKTTHADELVKAGLWERVDGAWQIHDFLDWQDSDQEANDKREQARERMRRVRANRKGTAREVTLTDRTLDPSSGSGSGSETGSSLPDGAREPSALQANARLWLEDPNRAALQAANPEKWPETRALVTKLKVVFGGAEQAPRHSSDSRMQLILGHWAQGREQSELERAIDGAQLDDLIRGKPQLQTLQTILKDSAAIDKYLRLLDVAPMAAPVKANPRTTQPDQGEDPYMGAAQ